MRVSFDIAPTAVDLIAALEGLTRSAMVDLARIEHRAGEPLELYKTTVVYHPEAPGRERWKIPTQVMKSGWGDCEDLAAWRAAELRRAGEPEAQVVVKRTGKRRWHAVVRRADGRIEDPTRMLRRLGRYSKAPGKEPDEDGTE